MAAQKKWERWSKLAASATLAVSWTPLAVAWVALTLLLVATFLLGLALAKLGRGLDRAMKKLEDWMTGLTVALGPGRS